MRRWCSRRFRGWADGVCLWIRGIVRTASWMSLEQVSDGHKLRRCWGIEVPGLVESYGCRDGVVHAVIGAREECRVRLGDAS